MKIYKNFKETVNLIYRPFKVVFYVAKKENIDVVDII